MFHLPASARSTLKSPPAVLSDSRLVPSAFSAGNFSVTMESSLTLLLLNFFGSNISIIEKEILCVDVIVTPQSLWSSILYRERPLKKARKTGVRNYACGEELLIVLPTSCLRSSSKRINGGDPSEDGLGTSASVCQSVPQREWDDRSAVFKASVPPVSQRDTWRKHY